jgi:hypothetical protein
MLQLSQRTESDVQLDRRTKFIFRGLPATFCRLSLKQFYSRSCKITPLHGPSQAKATISCVTLVIGGTKTSNIDLQPVESADPIIWSGFNLIPVPKVP